MAQPDHEPTTDPASPRVLLILPEEEAAASLTRALARAGFETRVATSAEAAAMAISHVRPAAILIDASFLGMRGHRQMEALRVAAPGVPIVVMADGADSHVRLKVLLLGAEDCLARPVTDQEAVLRVRRVVERRDGLRRLAVENQGVRERSGRIESEAAALRRQLRRNVSLLQRGVEFHQRLEPDHGLEVLHRRSASHLSAQIDVERIVYLGRSYDDSGWFSALASWNVPPSLERVLRLQTGGEFARLLESTGAPVVLDRLASLPGLRYELGMLATGGFTAAVPLLHRGRIQGLFLLGEARAGGAPDAETLQLAHFLTSALAPLMVAQRNREGEHHVTSVALGTLVTSLEGRDPYLRGHSLRVARLAEDLAQRAGICGAELTWINVAAVLHDIGRFEVDLNLWSKAGPLTQDDWTLIRRHPAESERLAAEASWPQPVLEAILSHHERFGGSGYPHGMSGESIPLAARIIAVADTYEALTSLRPHRPALDPTAALGVLRAQAGSLFDPELVALFVSESDELLLA